MNNAFSELQKDFKILDKQFDELPKSVIFCKNCVVSNQRPRTLMNEQGICSACEWSYEKDHVIDWKKREKELEELCNRYRKNDGNFDVVVPSSGGKDSAFVAHQLKYRYGMNPLCATWSPFEYTPIGWKNFQAFNRSGFTCIANFQQGDFHRKLSQLAFHLKGDAWEPFAYGQKAWAFHVAKAFNIPLIIYGENGELEYGGTVKYKHRPKEDVEDWEKQYYKGTSFDALVKEGIKLGVFSESILKEPSLQFYKAPEPDLIREKGIEMHWFSYYQKWTPQENFYYAMKHTGFETNDEGRSESTYTKYASLDDKADGFHWYLSYMKFGMGRASRDAQTDIRRHHITREEGVALVKKYDHEFPKKYFTWFLDYCQISEEFFWHVMDAYREASNAWQKNNGQWEMIFTPS
jgi:N-acetyl sugar amidotransferase